MSESNLTEKFTESITKIIKNTKVFEKMEIFKFNVKIFAIFSSIIGISGIIMHYYTYTKLCNHNNLINDNKTLMIDFFEFYENSRNSSVDNKITKIDNNLMVLLENQKTILNEIQILRDLHNEKISPEKTGTPCKLLESPKKNIEIKIEDNYDELLNECYDLIPLNNAKKITGVNFWLF